MADLSNQRYAEMLGYAQQLGSYVGSYTIEDLLAAGFSPSEVEEFEDISRRIRSVSAMPPDPGGTAVEADTPTLRESHAATLAELFGGEDYDRGDLLLARKFTGTAAPTATFDDSLGLADLFGLGALYGTQEGADTMVQGARSGDLGTVALGAAETGLNVLGAVPGAAFVTKAGGKLIDDALDASRRAEADKFFLEADAAAEGASGAIMSGERVFVPTEDDLSMMSGNPTPNEQTYLYYRQLSRDMADSGDYTPDEILEATGFVSLPVRGTTGALLGEREVFVGGLEGLRKMDGPDIEYVPQKELGRGVAGDFDPDTSRVRISGDLDLPAAMQTAEHETAHFDLFQAFSDPKHLPEVGSSQDLEQGFLRDKVRELRAMLKDPSLSEDMRFTVQALLDDIRKNESASVNYENNPGEIIARAASGELRSSQLASPKQ